MNWQVDLDVVYGSSQHNPALLKTMTKSLRESGIKGSFYIGYPVMASAESNITIDVGWSLNRQVLSPFTWRSPAELQGDPGPTLLRPGIQSRQARVASVRPKVGCTNQHRVCVPRRRST